MKFSTLPYLVQLFVFTLCIAGITRMGLMFSVVESNITQIWSPAGLSIVVLFLSGIRFLPAIFVGVVVNYLFVIPSTYLAVILAMGSTLEAFVGYIILKRLSFNPALRTLREVGVLILAAGVISTLFNALFSVSAYYVFNPNIGEVFVLYSLMWWLGNFVGLIVMAPTLFIIFSRRLGSLDRRRLVEFFVLLAMVFAISYNVFHAKFFTGILNYSLAFILFPFAIMSSIRYGMVGSVIVTYIVSVNATLSTQTGLGLFDAESYSTSIILVDVFLIVLGSTSLALAALIEERTTTVQAIQKSEESYRIITDRTGQLLYDYNVETGVIHWSGAITEVTQFTPGEFSTIDIASWASLIHPDDRERADTALSEAMRSHQEYNIEYRFRKKDGVYFDVLDRGVFLYRTHIDTTAYRMLGTMADISPVNRTLKKLRESEERFRILIEKSADGILLLNKRGVITFVSSSATAIIGYRPSELMRTSVFDILHPSEAKKYAFKFGRLTVEYERSEYLLGRFKHKNGEWVAIEGMVTNLFNNSSVNAFVANFRNVTERIESDDRLRRSLKEKEILLKEVHHRVKNNMQVISSLLNLQASSAKDKSSVGMFRDSQNRVKSMALVHEILYQAHDIATVNFSVYTKQLIASLQRSMGIQTELITVSIKIPAITLDIDSAIPCGLIVNELVSNALQYAFPKKRKGKILVEVKKRSSRIQMSIRDNGVGVPKNVSDYSSLGLKLVHALTEQLKGTIVIDNSRGTSVTIEFPLNKPDVS